MDGEVEFFAPVFMKSSVLWNVKRYSRPEARAVVDASFMVGPFLPFNRKDGGDRFLRNCDLLQCTKWRYNRE
jgi:hypothetical protein